MRNILQINTSLYSEDGQSSKLARAFVHAWKLRHPEDRVTVRDLAKHPIPHLTAERFGAFSAATEKRTAEQQAIVAESDALIEQLRQTDVLVLGLPMYNFGIPSTLKAWFDHIARAGVTFRYTASGPEGLLRGKKAYVLAARGGFYQNTARDSQSSHVKTFLGLLGISDVEFVYAEGLGISADQQRAALSGAHASILQLAA